MNKKSDTHRKSLGIPTRSQGPAQWIMNNIVRATFIIIACFMGLNVWADDWKYVGKNHYNCLQTMTFYEAESVEYTLNGNCKAWIKGISVGELNRVMKKNDREIVRKSAEKVLTSYIPPIHLLMSRNPSSK